MPGVGTYSQTFYKKEPTRQPDTKEIDSITTSDLNLTTIVGGASVLSTSLNVPAISFAQSKRKGLHKQDASPSPDHYRSKEGLHDRSKSSLVGTSLRGLCAK